MELVTQDDRETREIDDGIFVTQLAAGEEMSIQHLRMAPGTRIDEHDHPHEQVGFVYRGEETLVTDEAEITAGPGDSYSIPGGESHAAENRGDEVMEAIDVFAPPRTDLPWEES
jgi:quercetin dioxygenase-like cupin family protein